MEGHTQAAEDRPIVWREFKNMTMADVKPGDLIAIDFVFGVEHVTGVKVFEAPEHNGPLVSLALESRSLAFPHLGGGREERYWPREVVRGTGEPVLIVHTVHPRNPKAGSLEP